VERTYLFIKIAATLQYSMTVGFEVPAAVDMKSSVFWDITSCSQLKGNRLFGGTCPLPSSGTKNKPASGLLCFLSASCLAFSSTLKMKGTCLCGTSVDFNELITYLIRSSYTLRYRGCFLT
jgi:hypothetical protein